MVSRIHDGHTMLGVHHRLFPVSLSDQTSDIYVPNQSHASQHECHKQQVNPTEDQTGTILDPVDGAPPRESISKEKPCLAQLNIT